MKDILKTPYNRIALLNFIAENSDEEFDKADLWDLAGETDSQLAGRVQSIIDYKEANSDLFDNYNELPQEVKNILDEFTENGPTYDNCEILVEKLNAVGYTCEYYLDAQPFNLKKL